MAGLGSALDSALSGLRIAQSSLNVASTNISNVNTEGYTRKILPQTTATIGNEAIGVTPGTIIRRVDFNTIRDLRTQSSQANFYTVEKSYLERVQQFHGAPDKEVSYAAELADLRDSFSSLSDTPNDAYLLSSTVNQAQTFAKKVNEFAQLLLQGRNDAQAEMQASIATINSLLSQIEDSNNQIRAANVIGKSTAQLEDTRDTAVLALSKEIEISTYSRGDGSIVIQTATGAELLGANRRELYFAPSQISYDSAYPDTAAPLYLGNPNQSVTAQDITTAKLGGRLGALIDMRDTIYPQYSAQIDEMAHKVAYRMEGQGLRLFTDESGEVPLNDAPVAGTTPVPYVGFASKIQVNAAILADPTLLQKGTNGENLQQGSNEVISRILEYAFGANQYQEALGTVDLSGIDSANAAPNDTLFNALGLSAKASFIGNIKVTEYADLVAVEGSPFTDGDTIDITIGSNPVENIPINAGDTIAVLVGKINAAVGFSLASITSSGALKLEATDNNIQVDFTIATLPNTPAKAATFLGFGTNPTMPVTIETQDPYFDVQVGNGNPVRITIDSNDDTADLLAKLRAVPGLDATSVDLTATGRLNFHPANGGGLKIVDGLNSPFKALMGTGGVSDVAHDPLRYQNLGPGADITSKIVSTTALLDFSQRTIASQSEDYKTVSSRLTDEATYRDILQRQFMDESGVNLDEEMSQIILLQTAFAAAGKAITAINEMFDELINSII